MIRLVQAYAFLAILSPAVVRPWASCLLILGASLCILAVLLSIDRHRPRT